MRVEKALKWCLAMTMTLSDGKRTGFKVGSDYYHSVKEIAQELCSILEPEEYEKEMYHSHLENNYRLSTYRDFNMIYFQFLSFALFSLKEICEKQSEMKTETAKKINYFTGGKNVIFERIVPDKSCKTHSEQLNSLFDFAEQLRNSLFE